MKGKYIFLLLWVVSLSVFAQQSEVRSVAVFSGIKVSDGIDVYLKKGEKESVKIEVVGTELSNVQTEVAGLTLRIYNREQKWIGGRRSVKVYVTYTKVERINASSASNVFSEGVISSESLNIGISSAASVEIAAETNLITIRASSAGSCVIEGKTKVLEIEGSSGAVLDAYRLDSEKVYARSSSGSSMKINVSNDLDAHASSGGSIRYRGNPNRTNTESSSGGSVKKTS